MDFAFDNNKLSDFGYMVCSFDANGIEKKPTSAVQFHTFKAPRSNTWHKTSASYDTPLSATFQICKKPCTSNYEQEISSKEISEITRWLCRKNYKPFRLISTQYDDIYHDAKIDVSKIELGEKCIGFELTVTTNKPYGFSGEHTITLPVTADSKCRINFQSDEEGNFYPDIFEVTCMESGNLSIINQIDGRETIIANCTADEIITFNGKALQVSTSLPSHKIQNDFNWKFPRLCSTYKSSENIFTFSLNCNVTITYHNIRKAGL